MSTKNLRPQVVVSSGLNLTVQTSRTLSVNVEKQKMNEVKVFLATKDIAVRESRESGLYTLKHVVPSKWVLDPMDAESVIEYAIGRGFPGFDPEPSNVLPFIPKQFPDFSSSGVRIENRDYKTVSRPEGALTATDSPYGIGFGYDKHNDKMTDEQWLEMMDQVQKPCVVILPWQKAYLLVSHWGTPDDQVVWTYHSGYRGHQHRLILWFGCKPDMTRPEVGQEFVDQNGRWAKQARAKGRTLALRSHHWHIEQVMSNSKEKTPHPCQIPEEVMRLIVLSTAMPGQPIFDPFLGSGTTGVIARRFGFPFFGTDLSPAYCQIAKDRIMAVVPPAVPVVVQPAASNVIPFVLPQLDDLETPDVNIINGDFRESELPDDALYPCDPPYGIGFRYDVHNDKQTLEEWLAMMEPLRDKKCVFILPRKRTYQLAIAWGRVPDFTIPWVYHSNLPDQCREVSWWGCKPDLTRPEVGQEYQNPEDKRIQKRIEEGHLARRYTWWLVELVKNNSKEKTKHPCQIPEELMRLIIQSTAKPGQHICDPFLGSGTTGVVANRYGHPFSGWDISSAYVEIARERIAKNSGNDAESGKKAA
jgi:site-specific DNA-methyltransferase (adenine-specific)